MEGCLRAAMVGTGNSAVASLVCWWLLSFAAALKMPLAAVGPWRRRSISESTEKVVQALRGPRPARLPPMRIFGHRGGSAVAPENTEASHRWAYERGAAGVELDLQLTADGEVVVLHDDTLARTGRLWGCGGGATPAGLLTDDIKDLQYDDVKKVDVGRWKGETWAGQRVMRFAEALALLPPDRCMLVEVKRRPDRPGDATMLGPALAVARASGVSPDQLRWIGFDLEAMRTLKRLAPEYKVWWIDEVKPSTVHASVARAAEAGLDGVDIQADPAIVTRALVQDAHSRGLEFAVWVRSDTPDNDDAPFVWDAMARAGVDVLTSDLPPAVFEWSATRADVAPMVGDAIE